MNNIISMLALPLALVTTLAACGGGEANRSAGVGSQPEAWQFTQGQITFTGNALDVAIHGDGFFQVNSDSNMPMYTRRGSFYVDADGYIVNEAGLRLLLQQNKLGPLSTGTAVPLQLPSGYLAPVPTTEISLGVNLDASTFVTAPGIGAAINFDDAATYNNNTSVSVYNAKGEAIALTVYFQKAATDSWNVYATANGVSVAGSNAAPVAIGNLVFPESGVAPAQSRSTALFDIPATINANGAATQATTGVKLDLSRVTEFGTYFRIMLIDQNGSPGGILAGLRFEASGILLGEFSNGGAMALGQVVLATFEDRPCLTSAGNNLWSAAPNCGVPFTATPGVYFNLLEAGALEAL